MSTTDDPSEGYNRESVIQKSILEALRTEYPPEEFKLFLVNLKKVAQSEVFELLRQSFIESMNQPEMSSTEVLDELFTEYIEDWGATSIGHSVQEINSQKALGIDLWQKTIKRQYLVELDFLFNAGYLEIIRKFKTSLDGGDKRIFIQELYPRMLKLIDTKGVDGQVMLHEMATFNIRHQEYEGSTLLTKLMAAVASEIAGLFMKVKYFEILRKGQKPVNN